MGICVWSSGRQPANWANWATSASQRQLCHRSSLRRRRYFSLTLSAQTGRRSPLPLRPPLCVDSLSSFNLLDDLQGHAGPAGRPVQEDERSLTDPLLNPPTLKSEGWGERRVGWLT